MATRRQIMLMALLMLALAGCDVQQNVLLPSATATPNPNAIWSVLPLDRDRLNGAMGIAMTSVDSAWVVGSQPSLNATGSWAKHLQLVNGHW